MNLNERILENDYPVNWGYLYVADNRIIRSDIQGTIADLKRDLRSQGISCTVITLCDIEGRRKLMTE